MPRLLLTTYCCSAIYKDSWLSVSKAKLGTLLKNWLGKFKQISNIDHFLSNFLHWIKRKAKLKNGRAKKREIGVKVWTKDKMISKSNHVKNKVEHPKPKKVQKLKPTLISWRYPTLFKKQCKHFQTKANNYK